eukprot:scaffold24077_cov65-Phaeocystis_antarctica.AAC.2
MRGPLCSMPTSLLQARRAADTVRPVPSMPSCSHAALILTASGIPPAVGSCKPTAENTIVIIASRRRTSRRRTRRDVAAQNLHGRAVGGCHRSCDVYHEDTAVCGLLGSHDNGAVFAQDKSPLPSSFRAWGPARHVQATGSGAGGGS